MHDGGGKRIGLGALQRQLLLFGHGRYSSNLTDFTKIRQSFKKATPLPRNRCEYSADMGLAFFDDAGDRRRVDRMNAPSRILILTYTNALTLKGYFLARMVSEWKMQGIEVLIHHDLSTWVPADVCLVHVDLSVVPSPYIEFAKRYPSTINLHITDIRKKSYSRNRVMRGDGYEGPIIVKTSLNFAGEPERRMNAQPALTGIWQKFNRELTRRAPAGLPFQQPSITAKQHYRILPERRMLPVGWLDREDIVVERFRPERSGDNYVLREWYFLGDRDVPRCEISPDPIFTYGERCPSLERPPPDIIRQIRQELRVDYGKIDYTIDVDGAVVLLDVNKTIGGGTIDSEWTLNTANILAQGLNSLVTRSLEEESRRR